jgi:hypothetical protein
MREIPLTQGKRVMVDDDTFHLLKDVPFHAAEVRGRFYARSNRTLLPGKPNTYLHWIVIAPSFHKSFQIKFKDGNTLNCQRDNLIYIERSVNTQRSSKNQTGRIKKSKYIGVSKAMGERLKSEIWCARTKHEGKTIYIGRFATEEAAAMAYNKKMIELYGPNCRLNNINTNSHAH